MLQLRRVHNLLAAFFAPAIIFFAFTGALQTFGLHENRGGDYQPPGWIVTLASVHKDQTLPKPKPAAADAGHHEHHHDADDDDDQGPKPPSPLPLKIFVLAMAAGLIVTAGLGIYIGLKNRMTRRNTLIMLGLGCVLPVVLLFV